MNPVVILNPANPRETYQDLSDEWTAIEPPIWCRLLASYLDKKEIPVQILDGQIIENLAKIAHDFQPSVYIVMVYGHQPSASTQTMPAAIKLCKDIHVLDGVAPILVIGGHPAALPEQTLRETNADFVCTGEGFVTAEHLYRLAEQKAYAVAPLGVCYWDGDHPCFTNPVPNVWDMAQIPGGMWWQLSTGFNREGFFKYRAHNWHCFGEKSRTPYASIYTTLGCPYSCSFCCIQSPFKEGDQIGAYWKSEKNSLTRKPNSYRRWDPKHVVDELEVLAREYNVRHVKIADEMFMLNKRHVEVICDELKSRCLEYQFNFWFYSRVDTTFKDDSLLEKMKSVGMNWACLGIESGNDEVLGAVDKRDYGQLDCFNAVKRLQNHGINVIGNYIVGLPGDTLSSMHQTEILAEACQTEFMNVYPAVAYPGSRLFDDKVKEGWKPPEWSAYSFHAENHQPLGTEKLSSNQVLQYRDDMFQRYMNLPAYLEMIEAKFGAWTVDQIKKMASVKLKRKLAVDLEREP